MPIISKQLNSSCIKVCQLCFFRMKDTFKIIEYSSEQDIAWDSQRKKWWYGQAKYRPSLKKFVCSECCTSIIGMSRIYPENFSLKEVFSSE
jgi:hypothetical protein